MDGFAERLTKLRDERGETQRELAEAIKVDVGTVSRWERGIVEPAGDQLITLAERYGVTLNFLMRGERNGHPVSLPEFDAFLATEYGRIAQERGYIRTLLAVSNTPFAPTVRWYKALVSQMMLEEDAQKDG